MTNDNQFPIMSSHYGKTYGTIPFAMLVPHCAQALKNHAQSLERLRERGGLAANEALCILRDREYTGPSFQRPRDDVSYHAWSEVKWHELQELVRRWESP